MREFLRGIELWGDPIAWDLTVRLKGLHATPEQIFDVISDPKEVTLVPGFQSANLIKGKERTPGARYECVVGIDGISIGGLIVIELTTIEPPYRASAQVLQTGTPFRVVFLSVHAKGTYEVVPGNDGCDLVFNTVGEVGGIGTSALRRCRYNEEFIERGTIETLKGLRMRINNGY